VGEIGQSDDTGKGIQPVTVFVSDPSAEAERIAHALRGEGYAVVDVPLSMLVARVAVQRPRAILVDADTEGALDAVGRVRELSDADSIDVVFLGKPGHALGGLDDALANDGSGFFARPVDASALLAKMAALIGAPNRPATRTSAPPADDHRPSSRPAAPSEKASLPPPSMRSPDIRTAQWQTPAPRAALPGLAAGLEVAPPSMRRASQAPLSAELEALLLEAEQRMGGQLGNESMLPSPEEEIEAVLPADVLASLDEPIDDDDEYAVPVDPLSSAESLSAHHKGNTTGAGRPTTGGGTPSETGSGTPHPALAVAPLRSQPSGGSIVPQKTYGGTLAGGASATTGASATGMTPPLSVRTNEMVVRGVTAPPPTIADPLLRPPPSLPGGPTSQFAADPASHHSLPLPPVSPAATAMGGGAVAVVATVLGRGDAPRPLASAIAGRTTGVLAYEHRGRARRIVLREGDIVTAASTVDEEALLPFLAARGELPRDRVAQLAGKVPPSGRHAGAALVAHGYLRQDQMWSVLRAHAEWIIGRVVSLDEGTAGFEPDLPGRLRSEPSVFGGSTGAEVLVEVVRRAIAPDVAIERMGGDASRVTDGPNVHLGSECALGAPETAWLASALGSTLGGALQSAADPDFAAVLYALVLLGVCDVIRGVGPHRSAAASPSSDPLDDEAIRARIRARLYLVDEGDYFAVLGVSRDATSYEVKRAFLELRRTFEPSKLLTPALADLAADVRKVATVLDEAYEILRDEARRTRYRRAIDTPPR
jgi:hypothetical protein